MRDKILDLIRHNPFLTQKEIAMVLGCSIPTVKFYFRVIGIKSCWNIPKDIPKDISKDISKDIPKDISKDIPKDISKDIPKDISKDISKDIPKDISKDISPDEHINRINAFKKQPEPTPEYISLSDIKNIYDVQKQTMMGIIVNNNIETHTIKDRPYITTEDFYEHFDLFIKKHIKMTDCEKERLDENSKKVNDDLRQYDEFNCPID
jgi:hypothetical protein